jgi:hypothetical protein
MCVQNVPFKTRQEGKKRALERELRFYEGLGLSTGFVPLCAHKWVLFDKKSMNYIKCPEDKYILRPMWDGEDLFLVCPDCGLEFQWDNLEERKQLNQELMV